MGRAVPSYRMESGTVASTAPTVTRALPTGTTAFLFTDIEGSTVRWDRDPAAMQIAVRRHDAIMRAAIDAADGVVFKTIGDAFCAVFWRPADALKAAITAQHDLAAEDFAAVGGVRVRMAVHVGESDERDADYFGPTLNRVARLLAIGHGGQILLSEAAAEAAGAALPDAVTLRDLGDHRLKDLTAPEHVFQADAPDLPSSFPDLRSLSVLDNNLPQHVTELVGRAAPIAQVKAALERERLVTLLGTGGLGKTRCAVQIGAELLDRFADGVWFVDLAPLADDGLIASTILSTLGATQQAARAPLDQLIAYLADRRALLVLDNCEHVVDGAARTAAAVLDRCPHVRLLATSREPLNIAAEHAYRLPSLDGDAAVALFAERAHAANPRFALTAATQPLVEEVCARLDGIALAIELAAARLRAISVDELSHRLHERFRILTGGSRAALPRQQTMRALIDWSFDVLAEHERAVFRRLAIFSGGFTLDAVREVCSDETIEGWATLDVLASLVDKSLVDAEIGETRQRYRLLQSIRDYARERLDEAGEAQTVAARHAVFFAEVARAAYASWDLAPPPQWLDELQPELDNVRAALTWALADRRDVQLGTHLAGDAMPIFARLTLIGEGIAWNEAALAAGVLLPAAVEGRLQYGLSILRNNQLALKIAVIAAERAVALFEQTDDERALTRALAQLAQQYATQARRDEARSYAERAIAGARRIGEPRLLASTLQRCASVFPPAEIERAREQFAESVALFRSLGRDDETSRALIWWGAAESRAGNLARAIDVWEHAPQLVDPESRMHLANNIASCAIALGDLVRAAPAARETFALAAQLRHPSLLANALVYVAAVSANADAARAAQLFGYARSRLAALDYQPDATDDVTYERLLASLDAALGADRVAALLAEGAGWSEQRACDEAARV